MSSQSSSALSDLIDDSQLFADTSVELLRFRQLASRNFTLEMCETLGDEIVNYLAGERVPDRVGCKTLAITNGEAPKDAPYLQLM
jgi:hypothetical protein